MANFLVDRSNSDFKKYTINSFERIKHRLIIFIEKEYGKDIRGYQEEVYYDAIFRIENHIKFREFYCLGNPIIDIIRQGEILSTIGTPISLITRKLTIASKMLDITKKIYFNKRYNIVKNDLSTAFKAIHETEVTKDIINKRNFKEIKSIIICQHAILANMDLSYMDFENTYFRGLNLIGVNLLSSSLNRVLLYASILSHANFKSTNIVNTDIGDAASLHGAEFIYAVMDEYSYNSLKEYMRKKPNDVIKGFEYIRRYDESKKGNKGDYYNKMITKHIYPHKI